MILEILRQKTIVFFFYGLAFFSMGVALLTTVRRPLRLPLIIALPWLAAYGILHGIHEWIGLVELMPEYEDLVSTSIQFAALGVGTLAVSVAFLFQFGVSFVRRVSEKAQPLKYVPAALFTIWLLIAISSAVAGGSESLSMYGDIFARYLLYFPGSLISGIAFYLQYNSLSKRGFGRVAYFSLISAILFWCNAFLAGLVVPEAGFFPASILNVQNFENVIGIPVYIFRGLAAIGIAVFTILAMEVFDIQQRQAQQKTDEELQKRNLELQILSDVSSTVARTLDLEQIIKQVTERITQLLKLDIIAFYLLDEEKTTLELFAHQGVGESFLDNLSEVKMGGFLIGLTAETGLPIAVGDLRKDPRLPQSVVETEGLRSLASVPIKARGETIGVMTTATRTQRRFTDRNMVLLLAIGNLIGTAIENAHIYEKERNIAETLQKSLLGTAPAIPELEIGIVYQPAYEVAQVGGDFFDFIEFTDGAIAVTVGDVSGKGLDAATLTAVAKNTIRAFAYEDYQPSTVLTRTNEIITTETDRMRYVTLLYLLFDMRAGWISMSSAGHPPPFICNHIDCALPLTARSLPLGAFKNTKYVDTKVELKPDHSLVLYTDGLTDARIHGNLFGEEGIGRVLAEYKASLSAQELAERLVESARDFAGGKLPDDVVVVVLKLETGA
ncbi:MAG: PP2C family protein-serine/threonine phosphatase [Candidatus Aquicultorales bacterium]